MLNTLYKLASTGKIVEWSVKTDIDNGIPYYSVTFGQQNGKLQTTKVLVPKGKNIGRSNETTPEQQCLLEAKSLWQKQKDRKGYSETIPTNKPLRPMLASTLDMKSLEFPVFIQPKLDGIRCLWYNGQLVSRNNTIFTGLSHIENDIAHEPLLLDGELYSPDLSFQQITSLVRQNKEESPIIEYHIYDIVDENLSFHERILKLQYSVPQTHNIKHVPTYLVSNQIKLEYYHNKFMGDGFEGSIIRTIQGKYEINKRSKHLLKYKQFLDEDFEIVGHKVGVGKASTFPTFILKTNNDQLFEATPIGTQKERESYMDNIGQYYGLTATVRFFEYTDGGIPRFPIMVGIRYD